MSTEPTPESMPEPEPKKPVERLFPFVLRARILILGRERLAHSKGQLHFILITEDLVPASKQEILKTFMHYPVVQHYTSADLEKFFGLKGTKVVGFQKSGLAQSVYAELKEWRINRPVTPKKEQPKKGWVASVVKQGGREKSGK